MPAKQNAVENLEALEPARYSIVKYESGGDYSKYNFNGSLSGFVCCWDKTQPGSIDLTRLTLAQVRTMQDVGYSATVTRKGSNQGKTEIRRVFAAGKYQCIPETLEGAIVGLKLSRNALFDKTTQDQIGNYLIFKKGNGVAGKYLKGENKGTMEELSAAIQACAECWAALPSLTRVITSLKPTRYNEGPYGDLVTGIGNRSAYGGIGKNRKETREHVGAVAIAFIQARINYTGKNPEFIPTYFKPGGDFTPPPGQKYSEPPKRNSAPPETKKKSTENSPPHIVIGDSQSPLIVMGSKKFKLLGKKEGEEVLWKVGEDVSWLIKALEKFAIDESINTVAISIGTNGVFRQTDDVAKLVKLCKEKMPNAKLLAVKGSWNWSEYNKKTTVEDVNAYYAKFTKLGVQVMPTPIGPVEPHSFVPAYKLIGGEIDQARGKDEQIPKSDPVVDTDEPGDAPTGNAQPEEEPQISFGNVQEEEEDPFPIDDLLLLPVDDVTDLERVYEPGNQQLPEPNPSLNKSDDEIEGIILEDDDEEVVEQESGREERTGQDPNANKSKPQDVESKKVVRNVFPSQLKGTEIKIPLPDSDAVKKEFVESFGNLPVVYYNGVQIQLQDIYTFDLFYSRNVPTIRITFSDTFGLLKEKGMPLDDTRITIFINSRSKYLKPVHMDFKILEFSNNNGIYSLVGVINVPELYLQKYVTYAESTSFKLFQETSKQFGMGFNTNFNDSDDKMSWINSGSKQLIFLNDVLKHSYVSDTTYLMQFIDYFYNLNYIDVEKEMSRSIKEELGIANIGLSEIAQVQEKDKDKVINLYLTNEFSVKETNNYFEKWELINNSTKLSLLRGYLTQIKYYDQKEKSFLQFDVDAITGDANQKILLRGMPQDEIFFKENISNLYSGRLDTDNVHKNYHYAVIQNRINYYELSKIGLLIDLPSPNFNIYKYQKIIVIFSNNAPNPSRNEMNTRLTGEWLVTDITFSMVNLKFVQRVTLHRRDLELSNGELKDVPPPPPSKNNDNNRQSGNENPIDQEENIEQGDGGPEPPNNQRKNDSEKKEKKDDSVDNQELQGDGKQKQGEEEYNSTSDVLPVKVCAHAAFWDNSGSAAENSLKNFQSNVSNETEIIEIDIQITKDGIPVLFHDNELDTKTDSKGKISDKNWSEVQNISYLKDKTQKISSLQQVATIAKGKKVILQLDKCGAQELTIINDLGIFKGMENQILAKGQSWGAPQIAKTMGIKWMAILPNEYVDNVKTKEKADEIIAKVSSQYLELQFSDYDTYITNGYLADKLREKGVEVLVVAVGGTKYTNGKSYRGDNPTAWTKIVNNVKPSIIMTNRPFTLGGFKPTSKVKTSGDEEKKSTETTTKRMLIVGDSQSAIRTASGKSVNYTYPNLLIPKLKKIGIELDVLAIGGKTTDWMLDNLPSQLKKHKYDIVMIYGGGNDSGNLNYEISLNPPSNKRGTKFDTLSNFQKMVDLSVAQGADVFVNLGWKSEDPLFEGKGRFANYKVIPLTIYLTTQEEWIPFLKRRMQLQNLLPTGVKNVKKFIPEYDLKGNTPDGIHPSSAGHKIAAEVIYDEIFKKYYKV